MARLQLNLPPVTGLLAHAKLSVIMDQVVLRLYGHNSGERSTSKIVSIADELIKELKSWMEELPGSLRIGCHAGSDRSCVILHLIFNHVRFQ